MIPFQRTALQIPLAPVGERIGFMHQQALGWPTMAQPGHQVTIDFNRLKTLGPFEQPHRQCAKTRADFNEALARTWRNR